MDAFTLYARGVDVSRYQKHISWDKVAQAGMSFAFIRVSDGAIDDTYFIHNYQQAGRVGLLRGAYHVLRPEVDGQAMDVFKRLKKYPLELGLWADIEIHGLTGERCWRFLQAADRKFGYAVGVYSRASFLRQFGIMPWSVARPLWIASPGQPSPIMPADWQGDWDFWQVGQLMIDDRTVDWNLYHGTAEEMRARYRLEKGNHEKRGIAETD